MQSPTVVTTILMACSIATAADPKPGDAMLSEYFATETAALKGAPLGEIRSADDWRSRAPQLRAQLAGMLGLDPMPERTPLKPVVTGTIERDGITVDRLHFQSSPGLYVTANFFRPSEVPEGETLPTILYLCGHGKVAEDGVSYGNKTHYHHHGAWFARNGYACLTIDTIQLGEIEGMHHGTYRFGKWWWNARGYTPAGVEAWNGIRALDYLETRPVVDATRIGVTGRSGGGAYSWWVAALDELIKAAVPVAGITTLENHVVDGCIEGHCDCMFFVNSRRWDFGVVAALVAPRPLLIANTDKDPIFPLGGVADVYEESRRIYELLDAGDKIGLHIVEGGHKDTQRLRVGAFQWFDRFLKGDDANTPYSDTATKVFEPSELRVFAPGKEPDDERVTSIHESFVAAAEPASLTSPEAWAEKEVELMAALRTHVFAGWPEDRVEIAVSEPADEDGTQRFTFESQPPFTLPLVLDGAGDDGPVTLVIHDEESWTKHRDRAGRDGATLHFAPRGTGPTAWTSDGKTGIHIRRRFHLLGQSADAMQVYDIRRAIQAARAIPALEGRPVHVRASGRMAINALYASLFEPPVGALHLDSPPSDHRDAPIYPNVARFQTVRDAVTMAARRGPVVIATDSPDAWKPPVPVDLEITATGGGD